MLEKSVNNWFFFVLYTFLMYCRNLTSFVMVPPHCRHEIQYHTGHILNYVEKWPVLNFSLPPLKKFVDWSCNHHHRHSPRKAAWVTKKKNPDLLYPCTKAHIIQQIFIAVHFFKHIQLFFCLLTGPGSAQYTLCFLNPVLYCKMVEKKVLTKGPNRWGNLYNAEGWSAPF